MMKEEFEKFVGETVSNEDYNVIETVYIWHPSISEVSGKDQISSIYRQFGMPVIHDMLETAMYAKELDAQRRQLMRCVDEIDQRFCKLQNGDLTEERCRTDADKLFASSHSCGFCDFVKSLSASLRHRSSVISMEKKLLIL